MLCILLIDDNPDDRLLVTRQLLQEFTELEIISVIDASNFEEALSAGKFDLVITDYFLRWTDGLKVVHAIKAKYPDCPIIMFTDSGTEEIAVEGMKSGLSDYVLKGKPQLLTSAVHKSLEQQKIHNSYITAVEQLQLSEERLRLALDAADLGTWEWNVITNKIIWSANHERLFGLSPGSFGGDYETFLSYIHPEDREKVKQAVTTALETQSDYQEEYRVVWSNGNVRWIAGKGKFYYNTQSKVTRMFGKVNFITIPRVKLRECSVWY